MEDTTETTQKWVGEIPETCDLCKKPLTKSFTDGRTHFGGWAIMCGKCRPIYGIGHGLGRGQMYDAVTGNKILG